MDELGAKLKKIRMERGISLEEVQKKTRIHLGILKAIEGDSLTNLSPVYLKSFLKIYCRFLGIPEEECAFWHKQQPAAPKPPAPTASPVVAPASRIQQKPGAPEKSSLKKASEEPGNRPSEFPWKKIFIFIGIAVLLFFIVSALTRILRSRPGPPVAKRVIAPAVAKKGEKKTVVPKPKAKTSASAAAQKTASPAKNVSSGISLGIRAKENCFIVLKCDGRIVFQRVLGKGRYENWRAADKMELSLGNAGAVELEVNGQLFSKIGRKGQAIKNILITKEGMRIP